MTVVSDTTGDYQMWNKFAASRWQQNGKKKAHKSEIVDKRTQISNSLVSLADFDYER